MALYQPLIDNSYFEGELTIGSLENAAVAAELILFIRRHEIEFLTKLMGNSLFEAFHAAMKQTTPDNNWKRMAYGETFVLDVNKVKTGCKPSAFGGYEITPRYRYMDKMQVQYKGLMLIPSTDNFDDYINTGYGADSAIAQYIYYWWMRNKETTTGGAGESKQQIHNAAAISNAQKMTTAYNAMCKTVFHFYLFLDMNADLFPEFDLDVNSRYNPAPINTFNFL